MIEETLMTGMTDRIDTGTIMDGTRDTTGITPLVTTNDGTTMASMTTSPVKVTETKRISTRNVISTKRGVIHGNRKRALQATNRTKTKHLP